MTRPHSLVTAAAVLGIGCFAAGSLTVGGLVAGDGTAAATADSALVAAANTTQDSSGISVDTCTLITEAEASAALGVEVAPVPNPTQCTYVAMDGTGRALSITVPDYTGNNRDFSAGVEQAAHAFEGSLSEIAAGDEGYAIVSPMVSEGLARNGSTYVVVVLTKAEGSAAAQADQLNGLLQTAFGRL